MNQKSPDQLIPDSTAMRLNLRRLSIIRNIALGGQILALFFFSQVSSIGLPFVTLSVLLAIYAVVIGITWWRSFRQPAITQLEFFNHLLVDIAFFTMLVYFSGGAANPFISYYLVPISIAAATLPVRFTWVITAFSLLAYIFLMAYYVPIPALMPEPAMAHHSGAAGHLYGINLHLLGMWFNFAISAALITYFVTRMAKTVREQKDLLNQRHEDALRNDQVLAIGTLAAGTAHELGTPLNTMKVLIDDLLEEDADDPDMQLLKQQVNHCTTTLKQLVATAESATSAQQSIPLRQYFSKLLERWLLMRPQLNANISDLEGLPELTAQWHPTIAQSLLNLLNNAADASPEQVDVNVRWNDYEATITIRDYGSGIDPNTARKFGQPLISEKPGGLGLGIFLAHTALDRFGGSVTIRPAEGGGSGNKTGSITTVKLPLQEAAEQR